MHARRLLWILAVCMACRAWAAAPTTVLKNLVLLQDIDAILAGRTQKRQLGSRAGNTFSTATFAAEEAPVRPEILGPGSMRGHVAASRPLHRGCPERAACVLDGRACDELFCHSWGERRSRLQGTRSRSSLAPAA